MEAGQRKFSDGSTELNVVNQVCLTADGTFKLVNIFEHHNWGMLAKFAKSRTRSSNEAIVYHHTTF